MKSRCREPRRGRSGAFVGIEADVFPDAQPVLVGEELQLGDALIRALVEEPAQPFHAAEPRFHFVKAFDRDRGIVGAGRRQLRKLAPSLGEIVDSRVVLSAERRRGGREKSGTVTERGKLPFPPARNPGLVAGEARKAEKHDANEAGAGRGHGVRWAADGLRYLSNVAALTGHLR